MTSKRSYTIDLGLPEKKRWAEVISKETKAAKRVAEEALEGLPIYLKVGPIAWAFEAKYRASGGLYVEEMAQWAKALGASVAQAIMLNCLYELSHVRVENTRAFGCTTGVRWVEGLGMVHVRTLDWPLDAVRAATRTFQFVSGQHNFTTIGIPGHVGVLSGMVPERYSVTINWAPPPAEDNPSFSSFGPAFLLREVLQHCHTYDEAVRVLAKTALATSVFFTICGAEKDQACVIERTAYAASIRPMRDGMLLQGNHYASKEFYEYNDTIRKPADKDTLSMLQDSKGRCKAMKSSLAHVVTEDGLWTTMCRAPVNNEETQQRMYFRPGAGETTHIIYPLR